MKVATFSPYDGAISQGFSSEVDSICAQLARAKLSSSVLCY